MINKYFHDSKFKLWLEIPTYKIVRKRTHAFLETVV